ncbi:MAG: phosphate acyltransferase PlsX [bacterium]|nr:phosphate acyltransferase PlsX [bacterium]
MRIAVDAMGGDHAPGDIVEGSRQAVAAYGHTVLLVGRPEALGREPGEGLEVVPASEVIEFDEAPAMAIRKKKDSSIAVGLRLLKEGRADALVSAGSTGALMAGGLLMLGRLPGIERPALAGIMPGAGGRGMLMLDLGAHTDAGPEHLCQWAIMGSIYAEKVMGIPSPRVGLANIGTEPSKGNEAVKAAYPRLAASGLNFAGNVEGRDIPACPVDVLVWDGFVGNIVLKYTEGLATSLFGLMKEEFTRGLVSRVGALMLLGAIQRVKARLDYSEHGGAPLLGIRGAVIKCHGSSRALAIKNGIRVAAGFAAAGVNQLIAGSVGEGGPA